LLRAARLAKDVRALPKGSAAECGLQTTALFYTDVLALMMFPSSCGWPFAPCSGSFPSHADADDDDKSSVGPSSASSSVDGGDGGGASELSLDGSPIKLNFGFSGTGAAAGSSKVPAGSPVDSAKPASSSSALTPGSMAAAIAGAGFDKTPTKPTAAELRRAESESRKQAIRAALLAGTYEEDDGVCTNCSS
jgi:hypothetical protein